MNHSKEDIFDKQANFDSQYSKLTIGTYFSIPSNNVIVKKYIDSKKKGNYRSLIFDVNNPASTLGKNLNVFKSLERYIQKPFDELTQEDVDNFQEQLNSDLFITAGFCGTKRNISYSFKLDLIRGLKQFWKFYRLYAHYELQKEIPNIVEYLKIRRNINRNRNIRFITKEDVEVLSKHTGSIQMRAFLWLYFELGARVIEILCLKKENCFFDTGKGVWIIRLPQMKGISSSKVPIELTLSNKQFNDWMTLFNERNKSEYVFQYTYSYIRKYFSSMGYKYLKRKLTPKQMRKGTTMFLINNNVNEQYIKAHLGWSADSHVLSHYINQTAIKKPDALKKVIENDVYSDIESENKQLRFNQKHQESTIIDLSKQIESMKQEQLALFRKMNEIDVGSSKNMLKAVFEELKLQNEKKISS